MCCLGFIYNTQMPMKVIKVFKSLRNNCSTGYRNIPESFMKPVAENRRSVYMAFSPRPTSRSQILFKNRSV